MVQTIPDVGPQPHGIAIDPAVAYVYVTCENVLAGGPPSHHPVAGSKRPGFMVIIDVASHTIVKSIEVGNFASGIEVVQ